MDKLRAALEASIIGQCVMALIDDGYRVQLCDQDGGGLFVYAMPDAKEFSRNKASGEIHHWIKLVPGNGADVIVDYSINLEKALAPANAFAASFAD